MSRRKSALSAQYWHGPERQHSFRGLWWNPAVGKSYSSTQTQARRLQSCSVPSFSTWQKPKGKLGHLDLEGALTARDRVGVQDFVLLDAHNSETAFLDNLKKRFSEDLIYVSAVLTVCGW